LQWPPRASRRAGPEGRKLAGRSNDQKCVMFRIARIPQPDNEQRRPSRPKWDPVAYLPVRDGAAKRGRVGGCPVGMFQLEGERHRPLRFRLGPDGTHGLRLSRTRFAWGHQGGTMRARVAPTARRTRMVARGCVPMRKNGPAWIRTRDRRIMSTLAGPGERLCCLAFVAFLAVLWRTASTRSWVRLRLEGHLLVTLQSSGRVRHTDCVPSPSCRGKP
jgi:hypothetical protein